VSKETPATGGKNGKGGKSEKGGTEDRGLLDKSRLRRCERKRVVGLL